MKTRLTYLLSVVTTFVVIVFSSCSEEPATIKQLRSANKELVYLYNSNGSAYGPVAFSGVSATNNTFGTYKKGKAVGDKIGESVFFSSEGDSTILYIYKNDFGLLYGFSDNQVGYHLNMDPITAGLLASFHNKHLNHFDWLLGAWGIVGDSTLAEVWEKESVSKFKGKGYKLDCTSDSSVTIIENLELKNGANGVEYIATVNGQNNDQAIHFSSAWNKDTTSIRFTAPEHDFPQLIEYTLVHPDTLAVTVGLLSDGDKSYQMCMYRIGSESNDCLREVL